MWWCTGLVNLGTQFESGWELKYVTVAEVVLLHLIEDQDIQVRFLSVTLQAYEVHEDEHSVGIWEVVGSSPIVSSKSPHSLMGEPFFYMEVVVVRFHLGVQMNDLSFIF